MEGGHLKTKPLSAETATTVEAAVPVRIDAVRPWQPLVPAALAGALGIAADQWLAWQAGVWLVAGVLFIAIRHVIGNLARRSGSGLLLLAAIGCLFAAWHHLNRHWPTPRDLKHYATYESQPAYLRGIVRTNPVWAQSLGQRGNDEAHRPGIAPPRSRFVIDVASLRQEDAFVPVSGRVQVFVDGRIDTFVSGECIEFPCQLALIRPPGNPGEYDFASHYRLRGITCQAGIDHAEAITVDKTAGIMSWKIAGEFRKSLNRSLHAYLSTSNAPLASAMLLGNRAQLDVDERDQFMLTGTVHLLAISGLHVGILASVLLLVQRTGWVPRRVALAATIVFVIGYAWLVEFRPPVVRAAILVSTYCVCRWSGRNPVSFNTLAFAALVVMAIDPVTLFTAGTMLSFLAVASIIFGQRWLAIPESDDALEQLLRQHESDFRKAVRSGLQVAWSALAVSGIVWLFAAPLVAARFHVVAPIALVVNPLLMIPLAAGLASGFGVLIGGAVFPPLAAVAGWLCDGSMTTIVHFIELAEGVPWGHWWTPGPGLIALTVFYATLLCAFLRYPGGVRPAPALALVTVWVLLGWGLPAVVSQYQRASRESLVCTFIDVGHGVCVLLEFPGGETMLYDCGSFGSPRKAANAASSVLWHHNLSHIDSLVLTHADSDHYNGVVRLVDRFSIDRWLVSGSLLSDAAELEAKTLFAAMGQRGLRAEPLFAGDAWQPHPDVAIRVLNPQHSQGGSDNETSLVLAIQFARHQILLTADLEGPPLNALMADAPPESFTVVLAPHHGSKRSEPGKFLSWSGAEYAVVSSRRGMNEDYGATEESPATQHQPTTIFHTGRDGAIRLVFHPDGRFAVRGFRNEPW